MRITKITIGRLFNLGSYEHVRYELSAEVAEGESASRTMRGLEKIVEALNPKTSTHDERELQRQFVELDRLKAMSDEEYQRNYNHVKGTRAEYTARVEQGIKEAVYERERWKNRQDKARLLLDNLGGAAEWKDAKLNWEDEP